MNIKMVDFLEFLVDRLEVSQDGKIQFENVEIDVIGMAEYTYVQKILTKLEVDGVIDSYSRAGAQQGFNVLVSNISVFKDYVYQYKLHRSNISQSSLYFLDGTKHFQHKGTQEHYVLQCLVTYSQKKSETFVACDEILKWCIDHDRVNKYSSCKTIQNAISRLRNDLGYNAIESKRVGYRINIKRKILLTTSLEEK